jgi:two-component system response regulator QseB
LVCGTFEFHTAKERKGVFMIKVLLATNDNVLERMLIVTLTINGLSVKPVSLMSEITASLSDDHYNILLLDQEFSDVCPTIREKGFQVPILVLGESPTVKVRDINFISKPFDFPKLKKTMNDIFRKHKPPTETVLVFGDIKVDMVKSVVIVKDKIVNLGKMELAIFVSLVKKTGRIVSKERMRKDLESQGYFFNTAIFHHIKELKRKMKDVSVDGLQIKSITGEGYQLMVW